MHHLGNTLIHLHWLPINYRIQYKLLLLVDKCLNGMGPDHLSTMFKFGNYNQLIYLTVCGKEAFINLYSAALGNFIRFLK